jgi:AI-2 transport protein TqsA
MAHPPAPGEPPAAGARPPAGADDGAAAPDAADKAASAAPGAAPAPATSGTRTLLALASLVIVVAGLKAGAGILVPVALALFLAVIWLPLLFWLRRKGVPRGLAVFLTILPAVVALSMLGLIVSQSLSNVAEVAPHYGERLKELAAPLTERLAARGIDVSTWFTSEVLDLGRLMDLTANTFAGVAVALSMSVLVPLVMVFILLEAMGFREKLAWALGRDTHVVERFAKINREVQDYLVIKSAVSLATGLLAGTALWLIGVDFPLLWGFLAFLLNYVPNIGSVVAAVPPVLIALVQLGVGRALLVALVYLAINMLLGNLLEPTLMGRRLRLSPLVVLLSLLFWGWVWGPVGMILSVPLTMVAKILLENIEGLAWVARLLDHPRSAREPAATP